MEAAEVIKGGSNSTGYCFYCGKKTRQNQTRKDPTTWVITCLNCGHHWDYAIQSSPFDWIKEPTLPSIPLPTLQRRRRRIRTLEEIGESRRGFDSATPEEIEYYQIDLDPSEDVDFKL